MFYNDLMTCYRHEGNKKRLLLFFIGFVLLKCFLFSNARTKRKLVHYFYDAFFTIYFINITKITSLIISCCRIIHWKGTIVSMMKSITLRLVYSAAKGNGIIIFLHYIMARRT